MRVECKNCGCRIGEVEAMGCLVYVIRLALAEVVVLPFLAGAKLVFKKQIIPPGLDLPLMVAVLVVPPFLLFWAFCPGYFEWLRYRKEVCPKCGQSRWSWGFSEGWGL
jgi:hypothetical protein